MENEGELTSEQQQLLELLIQEEGLDSSWHSPATPPSPQEAEPGRLPQLDVTTVIARSPAEVFAFTTDLQNTAKWLKGLVQAEPLSGGPIGVGSRWRYVRRVAQHVGAVEVEVIRHEGPAEVGGPPYRHCGRTVNMGIEVLCHYTFEAEDAGATRVHLELFASARNLPARFMLPMVVKTIQELDSDQLERLKRAIEQQA
jgi:hypothetical protein